MGKYEVSIFYRDGRGSRKSIEEKFETREEAEKFRDLWEAKIKGDTWLTFRSSHIICRDPAEQAKPTEPTHYKLTAKGISGGYYTALLPITEDLDKAIDSMDDDLILIGIERVCFPVKSATSMTTTRLQTRLSNN